MKTANCEGRDAPPPRRGTAIPLSLASLVLVFVIPLWFASVAHGQFMPRPTVIENVHIHTADGWVIEGGTIIIRGSRIGAVGADLTAPRRANRIDGEGLHVTPGLIDALSGLAMPSGGSGGNNPTASAHDAFDRYDSRAIQETLAAGVTTIYVSPAAHRGIGPAGSIIRLRPGDHGTFGEVLQPRFAMTLNMYSSGDPIERLQVVDSVRSQFRDARDYEEALEIYEDQLAEYLEKLEERRDADEDEADKPEPATSRQARGAMAGDRDETSSAQPRRRGQRPQPGQRGRGRSQSDDTDDSDEEDELERPSPPSPNPRLDVLIKALNHELPVRVQADRAEDILNALEIADEFMLKITIEGGAEAHLVADEIAAADVPVILVARPSGDLPRRGTQLRSSRDNVAALDRAGIAWTLGSGVGSGSDSRYLFFAAQLLKQHAPMQINALELLTARAAKMLGIDDRVGRLAEGMQADIVLWNGDPADPASRVQRVMIAGQTVYQRTEGDS